jgi:hypothetical protein
VAGNVASVNATYAPKPTAHQDQRLTLQSLCREI